MHCHRNSKIGNPLVRQAAEAAWRTNSAKALVQAMIATNPKRAGEMLGVVQGRGRAEDGTAETVSDQQRSATSAPASTGDHVSKLMPEEGEAQSNRMAVRAASPWIVDLPPNDLQDLGRKAQVAMTEQIFDARTNVQLAYQNAPDALMYTGTYAGKRPGDEDLAAVYGVEEGGRESIELDRTFKVGTQAFDMVRMPKDAIEAKVLAAEPKPGSTTPEQDQAQFDITTSAAKQVLHARAVDPAEFVRKIDPIADGYWDATFSKDSYDLAGNQKAIARSVAVQKQLGIKDIQPLPGRLVKTYIDIVLDRTRSQREKDVALSALFAGTTDTRVLSAMSGQLALEGLSRLLRDTAFELPSTPAEKQERDALLATWGQSPDASDPTKPTMRQRLGAWALDQRASSTWGNLVLGTLGSRGIHETESSLIDFTPLGALFSADEAKSAFDKGDYGEAALNAAGAIPAGAISAGIKRAGKFAKLDKLFSRVSDLYSDVPDLPHRPFEADYPNGPFANEKTQLRVTSRDHEIVARYVAGRNHVGGADLAISPIDARAIGEKITGNPIKFEFPKPGEEPWIGKIDFDAAGQPVQIYIQPGLTEKQYNEALLHEVAHAIDLTAGPISPQGAVHEVAPNYSILAGGDTSENVITPHRQGYKDQIAQYEYVAEAIRAYMANPNYFKTVAPIFAAKIQDVVNMHPVLKHIIQFNSLLVAAGTVAGIAVASRAESGSLQGGKL